MRELRPQLVHHLECGDVSAFAKILQADEHASRIETAAAPGERGNAVDRWVLHHDGVHFLDLLLHRVKRDVLLRDHTSGDAASILLREKAFGNDDVKIDIQANGEK